MIGTCKDEVLFLQSMSYDKSPCITSSRKRLGCDYTVVCVEHGQGERRGAVNFCKADIVYSLLSYALTRFNAVVSQSLLLFPAQHCPTSPLAHHRITQASAHRRHI